MSDVESRIRARAHALWEEQGRPAGKELEHWDTARSEILQEDETPQKPAARTTARGKSKTAALDTVIDTGKQADESTTAPAKAPAARKSRKTAATASKDAPAAKPVAAAKSRKRPAK